MPNAPAPPPPAIRPLPRAVWTLGLVSLFVDLSSEMLYPVLPLFRVGALGTPLAVVGLIEGAAEVTAGLLKGTFGALSDRLGKRKPFVVAGYALSALSKPLPGLLAAWPVVLFARVLDRVGKGVRTAPRDALLAAYSTPETRGRVFGLHRALDTLGAALGPLFALVWLAYRPGDYRPLFLIAFVPAVIGAALTLLVRDAKAHPAPPAAPFAQAPTPPPASMPSPASMRAFWASAPAGYRRLTGWLVLFALFNSSDVFLLLRVREAGLGDTWALGGYVLYNLVFALAAYPAGRASDRWGRRPVLAGGLVLFALAYGGFAFARTPVAFGGLFVLYGLYAALTEGVAKAWLSDYLPDAVRGRGLGLFASASSLAALAASALTGVLWSTTGPALPFALAAGAALVTAAALAHSPRADTPGSHVPR